MAAKNNGGIVIAQVRRKIKSGSVHPRLVMVPGKLVDFVVFDERDEAQVSHYPDSVMGGVRQPVEMKTSPTLDQNKVILRRMAMELRKGDLVNLGFGIPANLPAVAVEEGFLNDIQFSIEHGPVGGVPGWTGTFGVAMNPDLILESNAVFEMYSGGILDVACLGMGEVDPAGNVNNHKFKNIIAGTGGFNDIIYVTPTILFAGTFTAGGLKTAIADGKLIIEQEGKYHKFNADIEGITLNAKDALKKGQRIVYITERAVFELREAGVTLTEIAPGVDLKKNILDILDFELPIERNLKQMDSRLFYPEIVGITLGRK
jgi:propionate CoA-transferase